MKYFVGLVLIVIGGLHGLHVLGIEYGSVGYLNGTRFLAFASLDRIAASGILGKTAVMIIDVLLIVLGTLEIFGWRLIRRKAKVKRQL